MHLIVDSKSICVLLSGLVLLQACTPGDTDASWDESVGEPKLIYGSDDRLEDYEVTDPDWLDAGNAAVALLDASGVSNNGDGTRTVEDTSYFTDVCSDEPFYGQPNPAWCSGFLVSENQIVTAGHCVDSCADIAFVFGYEMSDASTVRDTVLDDDVYWCDHFEGVYTSTNDWALVTLDRDVVGHDPLILRDEGAVSLGDPLLLIGHPYGLPLKYAGGAEVKGNSHPDYFEANVDAYGGNSGSAVLNSSTLMVEGILVRGNDDWVYDRSRRCWESNVCPDGGCPGWEDVTRITNVVPCEGDEFDPNDTQATAAEVGNGSHGSLQVCSEVEDWFAIPVNDGDDLEVRIDFTHAVGDLDLELYDGGTRVDYSWSTSNSETVSHTATSDGFLHALVYGYSGASGDYSMEVSGSTATGPETDADGDGYDAIEHGGDDCDDSNDQIHPGMAEVCNDVDDDCDTLIDDADPDIADQVTWYADTDGDTYGDDAVTLDACDQPAGYVADETDCDDGNTSVHPGAAEVCNDIDDDCDLLVDDEDADITGQSTWYADTDGDTYGDAAAITAACDQPAGYVADSTDCDDTTSAISPAATEVCNAVDDDCDTQVDDDDPSLDLGSATDWFSDVDSDGYGDPADSTTACAVPAGHVANADDCAPTVTEVNPGATEVCNDIDDDCNSLIDDADPGITGQSTWYADTDGDLYGDPAASLAACDQPAGYVADNTDCQPTITDVNPGVTEICNDIDDDCDSLIDDADGDLDASTGSTWYADADTDGYGDPASTTQACDQPSGYVADATDCDPGATAVHPGAVETCNDIDDDCDTLVDDADPGVTGQLTWYADGDTDGYGDPAVTQDACDQPAGYVADATDCAPGDGAVNPGATEVCNDADDDCDSLVDDADPGLDASTGSTWYADGDTDGYGDPASTTQTCDMPAGYVANDTDCAPSDGAVNPGATEVCNDADDDCDSLVDDADPGLDTSTGTVWYADVDTDGYGDPASTVQTCDMPAGYVADATDCAPSDGAVNPGATEVCNDIDDDCNSQIDDDDPGVSAPTWYADGDTDGYGDPDATSSACDQPAGYVADDTDCAPSDGAVNPGATEVCNDADDDCDTLVDDADGDLDTSTGTTWYADGDTDGYGDPDVTTEACDQPTGYVADNTDCDDNTGAVSPVATEVCNDIDDDCDTLIDDADPGVVGDTWYADGDTDGYGDPDVTTSACDQPTGYVADNTDCDDTTGTISPIATEVCNGTDDDCDTLVDDADPGVVGDTWYADTDSDGYGDEDASTSACAQPAGYVANDADCDDTTGAISPAATEVCNGYDDDCDTLVDDADASLDPASTNTWYADVDTDGYGDPGVTAQACTQPAGYVADSQDCDDSTGAISPAAAEVCNGYDDDCDLLVDDADADVSAPTWYADGDTDGYGDPGVTTEACSMPAGYVANALDCDDSTGSVSPDAVEVCNDLDDDCDTLVDDADPDITGQSTWYADSDSDTYGDAGVTLAACDQPSGYVADDQDCNDGATGVNPAAIEVCNGYDDDCDDLVDDADASLDPASTTTWYADSDSDSYGDPLVTADACDAPSGYVANDLDCNDGTSAESPDAAEVCNDIDDDCDELVDDADPDVTGQATWYADTDGDSYGDPLVSVDACDQPAGYVADDQDCNDGTSAVSPAATEICNTVDDDCDSLVDDADASLDLGTASTWYADADSDSYGDPGATTQACVQPAGYVADNTDCADGNTDVNPGATEVCNSIDDDCDLLVDDDDLVSGAPTWYEDFDGDTYGDLGSTLDACVQPTGYVADSTDCDDSTGEISPDATEVCNGIDDDCDTWVDDADPSLDLLTASTWYEDFDGDTWGNPDVDVAACVQPVGFVADDTDCDDSTGAISPDATEVCDGLDNDCDTLVDDDDGSLDLGTAATWYEDFDGDGFGNGAVSAAACDQPSGYVADDTDCDDSSASVHPGATEIPGDGIDQDCDGDDPPAGDTTPPVISNRSHSTWWRFITVSFDTDEPATGRVCMNTGECRTTGLGTSHSTGYFYSRSGSSYTIEVTDEHDNSATYGPFSK